MNQCWDVYKIQNLTNVATLMITLIIFLGNFVSRYVVIYIIKTIGFKSRTSECIMLKCALFLIQFLNSALLLLVLNANFWFFKMRMVGPKMLAPGPI